MKPVRMLPFLAALLAAVGCGGGSDAGSSASALTAAAPSYAMLSMDMTGSDLVAPSAIVVADVAAAGPPATVMTPELCHPHLFWRTDEVVERVNRHVFKFLRRIEWVIANANPIAVGNSMVWERVFEGVTLRFTVTHVSTTLYSWVLDIEPANSTTFTTVFSGQVDRAGATGPNQGTGTMKLDLTALHSVIPSEPGQGVLQASFVSLPASREIAFDAQGVTFDVDVPFMQTHMGLPATIASSVSAPRNAHYVYLREPGKGGSLKIKDQMVFLCPANPQLKLADVVLVNRWYKATDGSVHGRADAEATGGQLGDQTPTPIAKIEGVTCHSRTAETAAAEETTETYWLMKAEDATGKTIVGASFDSASSGGSVAAACDPLLNQNGQPTDHVIVPLLSGPSQDFDFSTVPFVTNVDLTDPGNQPYPFPGI